MYLHIHTHLHTTHTPHCAEVIPLLVRVLVRVRAHNSHAHCIAQESRQII